MKKKLKIIFLLMNSYDLPSYQKEILKFALKSKNIDVLQIIEIPERKKSLLNFKLINKIILKIFFIFENLFITKKQIYHKNIYLNLNSIKIIKINPLRKKFTDKFKNEDLKKIKNVKPDLIINFSDRLIKGKILKIPKLGIFGFHLSDTNFQRNGLGGFYEIIEKKIYSGITIQKYNNSVDGGMVVHKKFFKTINYFTQNHYNLLKETPSLFRYVLNQLIYNKIKFQKPKKYKKKLYQHPPSIKDLVKYIFLTYIKKNIHE